MTQQLPPAVLGALVLALLAAAPVRAQGPILDGIPSVLSVATSMLLDELTREDKSWRVAAGPLWLDRSQGPTRNLAAPGFGVGTINTDQLDFNYELGLQFNLIKSYDSGFGWDIDFFFVDGWLARTQAPGGTIAIMNPDESITLFQNYVLFQNGSSLYSTELNGRWQATENVTFLSGFRWIEFADWLTAQQTISPMTMVYRTDVNNHLYGFQTGADVLLWDAPSFYVDLIAKAGIYQNFADQNTAGPQTITSYNEGVRTAFTGQLTLASVLQLTQTVSIRSGYTVLWLNGVALAPGQVYTAGQSLSQGDSLYFNGGFLQLQINN